MGELAGLASRLNESENILKERMKKLGKYSSLYVHHHYRQRTEN